MTDFENLDDHDCVDRSVVASEILVARMSPLHSNHYAVDGRYQTSHCNHRIGHIEVESLVCTDLHVGHGVAVLV